MVIIYYHSSGDVKNTETLSLIVKKEVLLKHIESDDSDDETAIVNYVDAESLVVYWNCDLNMILVI